MAPGGNSPPDRMMQRPGNVQIAPLTPRFGDRICNKRQRHAEQQVCRHQWLRRIDVQRGGPLPVRALHLEVAVLDRDQRRLDVVVAQQ